MNNSLKTTLLLVTLALCPKAQSAAIELKTGRSEAVIARTAQKQREQQNDVCKNKILNFFPPELHQLINEYLYNPRAEFFWCLHTPLPPKKCNITKPDATTTDGTTSFRIQRNEVAIFKNKKLAATLIHGLPYDNKITTVAITPDGKTIVTGSINKQIEVGDSATAQCTATITTEAAPFLRLSFFGGIHIPVAITADGKTIIAGLMDGTIKIFDIATQSCTASFIGQAAPSLIFSGRNGTRIDAIAVNHPGNKIACASLDGYKIWNRATQKCITTFTNNNESLSVKTLSLSADGITLIAGLPATSTRYALIHVWDCASGECTYTFFINSLSYGTQIATIAPDDNTTCLGSLDDDMILCTYNSKLRKELMQLSCEQLVALECIYELTIDHEVSCDSKQVTQCAAFMKETLLQLPEALYAHIAQVFKIEDIINKIDDWAKDTKSRSNCSIQ